MSEVTLDDRGHALENEYFHRQEQELIEKMRAKLASENNQVSALKCPKCDGNLVESNYENIKIDVCNKCHGVWLDAGEMAQVVKNDAGKGWFSRMLS